MAASGPGNPDRGWNDPPIFDYKVYGSQGKRGHHRSKLNKRLTFPLSSDTKPPIPTGTATLLNPCAGPPCLPPVYILPPSTTTTSPTPIPVIIPTLSPTTDPCGDCVLQPAIFSPTAATVPGIAQPVGSTARVKDLESVLAELSLPSEASLLTFVQEGLTSAVESVRGSLQEQSVEDMKKTLAVMSEHWTDGKLSPAVKCQLGTLVAALKNHQVREAHELHLALMINHTTEVNQWLVAIKRIIQELSAKKSNSQVSKEQSQGYYNATNTCTAVQNHFFLNASSSEKLTEESSIAMFSPSSHGKDFNMCADGGR